MPAGFIPDIGLGPTLRELLGKDAPNVIPWELLLWTNNYVPDNNATIELLTEATFGGYSRVTLVRATWTDPTVNPNCAHTTWGTDAVVWDVTGGPVETIYGYAFVDPTTNVLRFIQRFDTPDIQPIVIGGRFLLLPQYTLTNAVCP